MTDTTTATPTPRLAARYVLHERIGEGGQGEVWRAHDPERGIDIALKILRPGPGRSAAAWQTLVHEHDCTSRLDHPHILKVYAPEREDPTFLLPMELAVGGDLRRLRGAPYLAVVPVLIEVAQALEHAHERGVIHRDLKPGNVLFDARGRVKLADFGVSGRAPDPGTDALIRGLSPFTASPEQLRGEPPAPSDDIYGLGALAYELLSRYPPHYPHFDARRVQEDPVPPLVPTEPIPTQLAALIARMLAKDAAERPASMREVIDWLDTSLNDTLTFDFETAEPPRNAPPANPTGDRDELLAAVPPGTLSIPAATVTAAPAPASRSAARERPAAPAPGVVDGQALWEEVRQAPLPLRSRLEPISRGPPRSLVVLGGLAAAAIAAFIWLPQYASLDSLDRSLHAAATRPASATAADSSSAGTESVTTDNARAGAVRPAGGAAPAEASPAAEQSAFDRRLAVLEARGAGIWGGADFAAARARAAESVGAHDAGSLALAQQRLAQAAQLIDKVERAAPAALAAELAEGDRALAAGQPERAAQAFDLAARIDPRDQRAALGQSRARRLSGVLPLLADAENAQGANEYSRAERDYTQALTRDPNNPEARAGLARADAAFGEDSYARAAGEGFAALGAGRLDEARAAFEKARRLRPNGAEAVEGLRRVDAAGGARSLTATRSHGADLEAQERWDEAVRAYEAVLRQDGSLTFAQTGKARAAARLRLYSSLQDLIDRPDRLSDPQVREQASLLLQEAQEQPAPGPVLRSQIARLTAMLPGFEKPVHISLVSDSLTQVAIPSVGAFGSFARHDIELKPGHYTVIGTRDGYRDVRRDLTISPGQESQTVNVRCYEPI
jgi:tetratricopeptide (TPR) repeat protein